MKEALIDPSATDAPLTVLHDGACPLCRREISVYRGLRADIPVCFVDVSDGACPLPPGTVRAQLLARFHVRLRDGRLVSGAPAFVALWAVLPGWRWLARLARLPGALAVMEWMYRLFLRFRPLLQRWAVRQERPGPDRTPGHGGSCRRPSAPAAGSSFTPCSPSPSEDASA